MKNPVAAFFFFFFFFFCYYIYMGRKTQIGQVEQLFQASHKAPLTMYNYTFERSAW